MSTYITPEEAVNLSAQTTTDDLFIAHDIYKEYMQKRGNEFGGQWAQYAAMAAIYNAGRVAGIRAERAKRKKGNA